MGAASARIGRLLRRNERGFTLIEAVMALTLFVVVGSSIAGLITSAVSTNSTARQRTLASQAALDQIEWIRNLDYVNQVGVVGGNPSGYVNAVGLKNGSPTLSLTGLQATVKTAIAWVNDPTPSSYSTKANYKKITVTVTRNRDSKVLATETTYMAPPVKAPLGGINKAIVDVQVVDFALTSPVANVGVALGAVGTAASAPESDVTDSAGKVTFPNLTPNPTTSDYYKLTLTPPSGYVVATEDDIAKTPASASARQSLAPGQNWPTLLHVYKPIVLTVNLKNYGGSTFGGNTSVTIASSRGSNSVTQTFSYTGSALTVTSVGGEPVMPNVDYTVSVSGGGFYAFPVTQTVGSNYASGGLTDSITVTAVQNGTIAVNVSSGGIGNVAGATVTVTGGPFSVSFTGTSDASGNANFTVPSGTGYTVTATKTGQTASQSGVNVTGGATTNVALVFPTATVNVTVTWGGTNVSGATVTISGGPTSLSLTTTTNTSGVAQFLYIPTGSGYTVSTSSPAVASLSGQTVSAPTTNFALGLPTGSVQATVTWGGVALNAVVVTLSGGPMSISRTGTTNSSGVTTFTNVPAGSGYTVSVSSPAAASVAGVSVTNGATTPVNVQLPSGSVTTNVTWIGVGVNGASVTISGGPVSGYSQTLTTSASGSVTFTNVPTGTGYTVTATKNGQSVSTAAGSVSVSTGSTTTVNLALPTGVLTVNATWGTANAADNGTITVTGGPNSGTYTGTIANGTVAITLPQTTASYPYTVAFSKSGATTNLSTSVTTLGATGTANLLSIGPTKTVTITVQRGGAAAASTGVSLSITGGPIGTAGSNPAVTVTGTTNGSGKITVVLPSGSGTYTIKSSLSTCGASGSNRSGSSTFSAASGTTTATVNMTSSTCPFSPLP